MVYHISASKDDALRIYEQDYSEYFLRFMVEVINGINTKAYNKNKVYNKASNMIHM